MRRGRGDEHEGDEAKRWKPQLLYPRYRALYGALKTVRHAGVEG